MSEQQGTEEQQSGTIVVGVDGSAASRAALAWAASRAASEAGSVRAVTAWQAPVGAASGYPTPYLALPSRVFAHEAADVMHEAIREALGAEPAIPIEEVVREGRPGKVLVEEAAGARLLVVGNRGHRAATGMVIGSVSEYCIIHARCPVVVVHAERAGAPKAPATTVRR